MINPEITTRDGTLNYEHELADFVITVDYFCEKLEKNHLLKKDREEIINFLRMFETIARN